MKDAVDEDRRPGRFLITGSANLLKLRGTEESLAGRAETIVLYGFSQGELAGHREDFIDRALAVTSRPWEHARGASRAPNTSNWLAQAGTRSR